MMFWFAVALLSAAVTYAVTRPLLRETSAPDNTHLADLAVYKDQLTEIEADAARGVLNGAEAEAARTEVSRRVLRQAENPAIDEAGSAPKPPVRSWVKPVYAATTLALPLLSVALYVTYGSPGLPGLPLSERIAAEAKGDRPDDLIAKVEARLRDHPEDGRGWDVIAPVYMAAGRSADAASAYAAAIKLLGETPERLQGFADARIRSEKGLVPEDARQVLTGLLAKNPNLKEPRIWLALAKEQDGKFAEAAADYRALIAEAPDTAPWRAAIAQRLAKIEENRSSAGESKTAIEAPATTAEDRAADVEGMSPADRDAFIGRMVDGLAARLKADGRDKDGWIKLIRAYQVLGRKTDAVKALSEARSGLAGDAAAIAEVEELAKSLGVGG